MPIPSSDQQQFKQPLASSFRFSSPFIGISFHALIEKPSDRKMIYNNPLYPKEIANSSQKRNLHGLEMEWSENETGQTVIAESPPRKRQATVSIQESPVVNHCGMETMSYLNQYRSM